jgi:hypothetical protein
VSSCDNSTARPQAAMEERPPKWRVAANILNKQSRTADKGWSSSPGLGEVIATYHVTNHAQRLRIRGGGGHL